MITLLKPEQITEQRRLFESHVVGKSEIFMTLFGLPADFSGEKKPKDWELKAAYTEDPLISDADKADPSMEEKLMRWTRERHELVRTARDTTLATGSLGDNSMTGFRVLGILNYMREHPDVSFTDAMDPEKDVFGKRRAGTDVLAASSKTVNIRTVTRGTQTAKVIEEGSGDDMVPIIAGAIRTLSSINIRDEALRMMGEKLPVAPERAKAIFSDPENQSTLRPIMAAISDFYTQTEKALTNFGVTLNGRKSGLGGKIADAVKAELTEEEWEKWELTQKNLPYLQSEQYLHRLKTVGPDAVNNQKENGDLLDQNLVARNMMLSSVMREMIAGSGTLAAVDADPDKTKKHFEQLDHSAIVFEDKELTPEELVGGDEVRSILDSGLPATVRSEIRETLALSAPAPSSPTRDIRREVAEARTPAQMEAVLEALSAAAPGLIGDDALKGMIGQARLTSNCMDVIYVDPGHKPQDGKQATLDENVKAISMLKPDVFEALRSGIENACDRIDEGRDPRLNGAADRYKAARAVQDRDASRKKAIDAGKDVLDVLSGITQDRVQSMEDLYSRMKADQSRLHRDSDQYKAMYQAVTAIHERASKGYDPKDPVQQAEMSKLFTDAYKAAQVYAVKEVAGKPEKSTQRGLDRKNFTLSILANTAQHRDGAEEWYLPKGYDHRRSTDEDPKAKDELGLDNLLKEEKRHNRSFREFLTGLNPFSEPLPKKEKPEITRKPIRGKKTSLDRLMDMEKHHKKLEPGKSEFDHVDENLAEEMRTNVYAIAAEESRKARESAPAGMGERTAKKDAKKTSGKKL